MVLLEAVLQAVLVQQTMLMEPQVQLMEVVVPEEEEMPALAKVAEMEPQVKSKSHIAALLTV